MACRRPGQTSAAHSHGGCAAWDVVAVGLGAHCGSMEAHLLHANRVVERVPPGLRPQAVFADAHQALHPDLADAGGHTRVSIRLAGPSAGPSFDARIARDGTFQTPRVVPRYIGFLNGHCSTHFWYPRHRSGRSTRSRLRAACRSPSAGRRPKHGIRAVVANPLEIEKRTFHAPGRLLPVIFHGSSVRIRSCRCLPRGAHRGRRILIDVTNRHSWSVGM